MWLRLLYLDKMNICDEWRKSPKINPRTNRAIKLHGPTYLKLERECGPIKKRKSSPKREPTKCPESSCAVHQLSDRTRIKRKMIKKLASLPNKQFDICMSGPRSA